MRKYWVYEKKKVICDRCYNAYPHCSSCGIPSRKTYAFQDMRYCPACIVKLPRCVSCKKPVVRYFVSEGSHGVKIIYCHSCYNKTIGNCARCGRQLVNCKFWTLNSGTTGRSASYCDSCNTTAPRCFACQLLTEKDALRLPDGRVICNKCKSTMLTDENSYRAVLNDIDTIFRDKLKLRHGLTHKLRIVDQPTLRAFKYEGKKNTGKKEADEAGLFKSVAYTRTYRDGKKVTFASPGTIYVLDHLPRDLAYWVLAHEYAHAWYKEKLPNRDKGILINEGFAEWVSYHLLKKKKLDTIAECVKKNPSIYGQGMRKLLEIEKKQGFDKVLEYVTK